MNRNIIECFKSGLITANCIMLKRRNNESEGEELETICDER